MMDMDGEPRVADDGVSIVDIGADEVDCEDAWNENDWTYDGVINFEEFSIFAGAWLSHDPNDPSLPTDPNFIPSSPTSCGCRTPQYHIVVLYPSLRRSASDPTATAKKIDRFHFRMAR